MPRSFSEAACLVRLREWLDCALSSELCLLLEALVAMC